MKRATRTYQEQQRARLALDRARLERLDLDLALELLLALAVGAAEARRRARECARAVLGARRGGDGRARVGARGRRGRVERGVEEGGSSGRRRRPWEVGHAEARHGRGVLALEGGGGRGRAGLVEVAHLGGRSWTRRGGRGARRGGAAASGYGSWKAGLSDGRKADLRRARRGGSSEEDEGERGRGEERARGSDLALSGCSRSLSCSWHSRRIESVQARGVEARERRSRRTGLENRIVLVLEPSPAAGQTRGCIDKERLHTASTRPSR